MKKEPNVEYHPDNFPSDVIRSSLNVSRLMGFMSAVVPRNSTEIFMDLEHSLPSLDLEEILGLVVREQAGNPHGSESRALLQPLQQDADHRVVAAALNGLQS